MRQRLAWMMAAVFLGSSAAGAQSLADIAEKERERREALDQKGKSFTELDLQTLEGEPASSTVTGTDTTTAGSPAPDENPDADAEDPPQEDPTQTQDYWRGRLDPVDARIADLETRLARPELQNDPMGYAQRQRIEADLAKARADRQAILDDGRRKGVPPGWLR